MPWIVLCVVSFILLMARNSYMKVIEQVFVLHSNSGIRVLKTLSWIGIIMFIITGSFGVTTYPYLNRELAEIRVLEERVKDIRNSFYQYKKNGTLIAGSIENSNQSTNLTQYMGKLAEKEAKYNGYLQRAKDYKEIFILRLFVDGWAISGKIYDLPIRSRD